MLTPGQRPRLHDYTEGGEYEYESTSGGVRIREYKLIDLTTKPPLITLLKKARKNVLEPVKKNVSEQIQKCLGTDTKDNRLTSNAYAYSESVLERSEKGRSDRTK